MKRPKKSKDKDMWKEINNVTKYVTGNKVFSSLLRKRCFIIITTIFCILLLIVSTFFIGLAMQSAFNTDEFEKKLQEESIVVDMNKVDIHASDKSLRLSYFEEETINQVFALMTHDAWWQKFLPLSKDKYDFTFYSQTGSEGIDKSLVQTDGFAYCNLKVKLRNLPFEFKLPVIVQIINTAWFYEKFMEFNHFESWYESHINGFNPPNTPPFVKSERRYHGYLNHNYHFSASTSINNTTVYQNINEQIKDFINDYHQEFANNTEIHPIITTIDVGDLNLNEPKTFLPFLNLIDNAKTTYVGNDVIGSSNEYVNLLDYTKSDQTSSNLKPFYIFYVSNPNVINDLILNSFTSEDELIKYFKNNPLDYLPFSYTQKGLDNNDRLIHYSPSHFLTFQTVSGTYFKYRELDFFLANVQSIKNDVEDINVSAFTKLGDLTNFLINKFWENIRQFLINNSDYFDLIYPNPGDKPGNWANATNSIIGLQNYFVFILDIAPEQLTSIQYLDKNHNALALDSSGPVNPTIIKNFNFNIGQQEIEVSKSTIVIPPHGLTYFFKTNWT